MATETVVIERNGVNNINIVEVSSYAQYADLPRKSISGDRNKQEKGLRHVLGSLTSRKGKVAVRVADKASLIALIGRVNSKRGPETQIKYRLVDAAA